MSALPDVSVLISKDGNGAMHTFAARDLRGIARLIGWSHQRFSFMMPYRPAGEPDGLMLAHMRGWASSDNANGYQWLCAAGGPGGEALVRGTISRYSGPSRWRVNAGGDYSIDYNSMDDADAVVEKVLVEMLAHLEGTKG